MSLRIPFVLAFLALVGGAATACSGGDVEPKEYDCPPRVASTQEEIWGDLVSPLLERRCGTLDCHGQPTRPMRIYSQLGLRHPDEQNVSGGIPTTDFEILDNYASVCGVDPEPMDKAAKDRGSSAEKLLLINKARGTAAHKGGKVVNENDAADQCILGWIRRATYVQQQTSCCAALAQLGATSKACP